MRSSRIHLSAALAMMASLGAVHVEPPPPPPSNGRRYHHTQREALSEQERRARRLRQEQAEWNAQVEARRRAKKGGWA